MEYRLITNLRNLNLCIPHFHFKMEGIQLLHYALLPQTWMVKINLIHTYYIIMIH